MVQTTGRGQPTPSGLLRAQHQVVARRQLLAAGMTRGALQHRLRPGGPWQTLLPGVYLAVSGTATADQREMAALLYAGPRSVITGPAALRRHGIGAGRSEVIDVLVPTAKERQSCTFVRVRHTQRMPEPVCVDGEVCFVAGADFGEAVGGGWRPTGALSRSAPPAQR